MKRLQRITLVSLLISHAGITAPATAQPDGRPIRPQQINGTASLDVFAQSSALDLLTTQRNSTSLELIHRRSTDGVETEGPAHTIDTARRPISARPGNTVNWLTRLAPRAAGTR